VRKSVSTIPSSRSEKIQVMGAPLVIVEGMMFMLPLSKNPTKKKGREVWPAIAETIVFLKAALLCIGNPNATERRAGK
jgi:hypothetical protein